VRYLVFLDLIESKTTMATEPKDSRKIWIGLDFAFNKHVRATPSFAKLLRPDELAIALRSIPLRMRANHFQSGLCSFGTVG
jgi:hypothetical protein